MIPAAIVFLYLAIVVYIGVFAFRKAGGKEEVEDYFLAGRSLGALVIPLSLLFIGTRVWALGKRFGFITPVQLFRDRWECSHIGTVIFTLQAVLLLPYVIIGVMGGGTTLSAVSGGLVP